MIHFWLYAPGPRSFITAALVNQHGDFHLQLPAHALCQHMPCDWGIDHGENLAVEQTPPTLPPWKLKGKTPCPPPLAVDTSSRTLSLKQRSIKNVFFCLQQGWLASNAQS